VPSAARYRAQRERDAEAESAAIVREARWRHEKLYNKAILLYCMLASEEERAAMAEPIGWQPVLDTDVTMEEHVHILQARVSEIFPQQWPERPMEPPSPPATPRLSRS
jgi:hypothetical protein